jgi:hypothetical protein
MDVSGDKKTKRISLYVSPLLFHILSKFVQALVITYDGIFQALAVEGDVLLPKPFQDPTQPNIHTRLGLLGLPRVWQTERNISEADAVKAKVQQLFLHQSFEGVVRWKFPASEIFFWLAKHVKVKGGRVGAVRWVRWGPETASGAGRLLLPPGLGKSHFML